jgi:hypothetical protein
VHPAEYNLALARAILDQLEPFLQAADAFWPLSARSPTPATPFPQLSLGALLVTLDELRASEAEGDAPIQSGFQAVERDFDRIAQKWRAAAERKASAESSQRLSIWRAYLHELDEGHADAADYAGEVRQRVILSRLLGIARADPHARDTASAVEASDQVLRRRFAPGEFIWDIRLRGVYPKEDFWFLYGTVRG